MSLLDPVPDIGGAIVEDVSSLLRSVAAQHGVSLSVVSARPGPTVTTYGIVPGRGVPPAKIDKLTDVWSLATGREVRNVGPRDGAILLEVPNRERRTVHLAEVLDPDQYDPAREPVVPIGWGADGNPIRVEIGRLPHMLVAGATGQGKSVFLNAVLISLLLQCGPERLRLVLIDPKRVELAPYARLPHLDLPVATDTDAAVEALSHAAAVMDARYALMESQGVRHYRDLTPSPPPLVVVIDELADLMLQAKKQVEPLIVRIAQLARAAGVFLVVGTQRPSVDVVTGLIKTNMPTRVAFRTMQMVDSRVILDRNGAERLTGEGDGLLLLNGSTTPRRFQAPWVSDDEIVRVVASHVLQTPDPEPVSTVVDDSAVQEAHEAAQVARAALAASGGVSAEGGVDTAELIRIERLAQLRAGLPDLAERVTQIEGAYAELAEVLARHLGGGSND